MQKERQKVSRRFERARRRDAESWLQGAITAESPADGFRQVSRPGRHEDGL